MDLRTSRDRGRFLAGLGLICLLGVQAFVRGVRVPLLGWIDLAIHEAGHLFFMPLPDLGTAIMGSGFQILVPLLLAAAFWWREHDPLGTAVCLGWAGTSMQDASVYIADAPTQDLQLIGGLHDWAWVFGPRGLDHLEWAAPTARFVWACGLLTLLVGAALTVAGAAGALPSSRAEDDDAPTAPSAGPAGLAVPVAHGRPVRPDAAAHVGPGPAGDPDPDGPGDPPRARLVW